MIIVAHRGNVYGQDLKNENNPAYIDKALSRGYFAEVDLRWHENKYFLGHDKPQFEIDINWLYSRATKLFIHLKDNILLLDNNLLNLNVFAHDVENWTITTKMIGWTCKKEYLNEGTVWVTNDKKENINNLNLLGVCTDYAHYYHSLQEPTKSSRTIITNATK